jgi:hypothetical protein
LFLLKNIIRLILFFLVLFSVFGCKTSVCSKKNTPASVSELFFGYLKNQEYDKAKELGTDHTKKLINAVQYLSELGAGVNILRDNKKELSGCEITGDEAVCTYKTFSGPDQKVYLVKVKGKWLVDLRKDADGEKNK